MSRCIKPRNGDGTVLSLRNRPDSRRFMPRSRRKFQFPRSETTEPPTTKTSTTLPILRSSDTSRLWARLLHHLPHGYIRTRSALFAPALQPLARFFQIQKNRRIFESRSPRRHNTADPIPHHPDFAVALKKKLVIDQPAVHDAGHHVPITQHHPDAVVFLGARRI